MRFTTSIWRGPAAWLGVLTGLAIGLASASPAAGQVLSGEWVQRGERRIQEMRRVGVRVIVLGHDGEPAVGVPVRFEQQRHAFRIGFVAPGGGWPGDIDSSGEGDGTATKLWRAINAVALDEVGAWPRTQPIAGTSPNFAGVDRMLEEARRQGWSARWGGIVSMGLAGNPDWVAALASEPAWEAVRQRIRRVVGRYGDRVGRFGLLAGRPGEDFMREAFGDQATPRLYHQARALSPGSAVSLRFDRALEPGRAQSILAAARDAAQRFVPLDEIALSQRLDRSLVQGELRRVFDRLRGLDRPITLGPVEVGGDGPTQAAINLEMLLRTAFAEPGVRGVYLAGLTAGQAADPDAALLKEDGGLTASGKVVAALFGQRWWTSKTRSTDDLGNVRARVFAGAHEIIATLEDGAELRTEVWVDNADRRSSQPGVIVLRPLRFEGAGQSADE